MQLNNEPLSKDVPFSLKKKIQDNFRKKFGDFKQSVSPVRFLIKHTLTPDMPLIYTLFTSSKWNIGENFASKFQMTSDS